MMRAVLRWTGRILLGLLGLVLVAGVAAWLWLRTGTPQLDGAVELAAADAPGLGAVVRISRDEAGVPFIQAESEADAIFALGFVHAQDRFAQMEFTRRTGAGRLAELVGRSALPVDRLMRTLGLYRLAEADAAALDPDVARVADAYAAGVNAWLRTRRGALPWELELLRVEPEPWRRADSLVWGRLMALRLTGNWGAEMARARLARRLPPEKLRQLYPDLPPGSPVTLATDLPERTIESMVAMVRQTAFSDGGSNAWAVAGGRTPSGKPVLANDPHLQINAPILWYLAHIEAPGVHLAGATVPGVPLLVLGHNDRIAWGMTTTQSDASDLFIEKVDPADPNRYLTPDGPKPFETREETIAVRFGEPVRITVRSTRHGPVVSDATDGPGAATDAGTVLALAANFLLPQDRSATALYRMGRARDWASFTAALADFGSPQQNIMYADVDGHIGLYAPARMPIRKAGDGFLPAPGWDGSHDWTGWIPFAELPHALDPAAGFLANANNRLVGPDYPYWLGRDWPETERAERIEAVLKAEAKHGPDEARRLQMDVLSPHEIDLFRPLLDRRTGDAGRDRALALLKAWDGSMRGDRPEPMIAVAWVRQAYRTVFADELGDDLDGWMGGNQDLIRRVLAADPSWCDDVLTKDVAETCDTQLIRALDAALDEIQAAQGADIEQWRWAGPHVARFAHMVFGRVPGLRDLTDVTIPNDGSDLTVNRAGMRLSGARDPYAQQHGPGIRAIYDLSDLDASRFSLALGQSGSPFSPHARDLLEPWRDGVYRTLTPPAQPAHALTLRPAGTRNQEPE